MEDVHSDFSRCATERSTQIEWSNHLFELASRAGQADSLSRIELNDVPIYLINNNDSSSSINEPNDDDESAIQSMMQPCILRSLYAAEIVTLETRCGCKCDDWSSIRILHPSQEEHDYSDSLQKYISDSKLDGTVVFIHMTPLKDNEKEKEVVRNATLIDKMIPVGIHGCTIVSNSMIHINTAKVHRCNIISHTYIDSYSMVLNCTYMAMSLPDDSTGHTKKNSMVNVLSVSVGAESGGGRCLQLHPESTMIQVGQQIVHSSSSKASSLQGSEKNDSAHFNVIGPYCVVRDTPTLCRVYLHPRSSIIAATSVDHVLLFPNSTIRNTSTVQNAVLQWDCTVTDHSYVSDVFLMEQAVAGPQSTVTNSVLGPDVHVSCGEVHASVLGPNTNAHHQSLVIATLWLGGRGNVAYGCNIGSNHTGRIPDQECCAGEGIFWGLSSVIKFPVDLTLAPYSIVAAGTTMVPQRCTMPFALIVNSPTGRSGTEIVPGWIVLYSPYTIVRSEQKFAQRRKAQRHMNYTGWNIIRPDIVRQCYMARQQLRNVTTTCHDNSNDNKNVNDTIYSKHDIPGLGANQMTEKGRMIGVQAYSELIQKFALQGLYTFLVESCNTCMTSNTSLLALLQGEFLSTHPSDATEFDTDISTSVAWPSFPWDDSCSKELWHSQRSFLLEEFPLTSDDNMREWIENLLEKLINLDELFSDRVRQCKQRDDSRGAATIPGYKESHVLSPNDAVVISVQKELEQRKHDVGLLMQKVADYF